MVKIKATYNNVKRLYPLATIFYGGDCNASVGAYYQLDSKMIPSILGSTLLNDNVSTNGLDFLLFSQEHHLAIVNSYFPNPYIGVGTWRMPDFFKL